MQYPLSSNSYALILEEDFRLFLDRVNNSSLGPVLMTYQE